MTDLLPPPGEFRTAAEIRDARYADRLAARRKKLLWWSAPVVALALLASLKMLTAVGINILGTQAYEQSSHTTAASRYSWLGFANVLERWKAPFDEGTAIYASGAFFASIDHFKTAMELVPKGEGGKPGPEECMVRTNYSLALEGLADEAAAKGDLTMSLDYLAKAQEMLADCGESGGNGGEQSQEAEQRQQQSQQDQQQQQQEQQQGGGENENDGGEGGETPTPTETPTDGQGGESETPSGDGTSESPSESKDPKQEQLESANESVNGEADESREANSNQGGPTGGQNW